MTFKNLKLQILFSGLFTLVSIHVSGQYLRNHIITGQVNRGFLQFETNFGYQFSFSRFSSYEIKERRNQLFVGTEIGTTKLNSNFFGPGGLISNDFQMHAKGNHLSFLLTNVTTKPKRGKKVGFRFNYVSLKFTINKFYDVKSFQYDTDYYNDGLDSDEPDIWITNPKCKSLDFALSLGKHVKVNSYNYLKIEIYAGLSFRTTSGIKNWLDYDANYILGVQQYKYSYALNPLILGFSLGYQINLGKQKK